MSTDGAMGHSGDDGGDAAAECPAAATGAPSDTRPWPERQPHVLWQCVFHSGHLTQRDAFNCMQVCRQWHKYVHADKTMWQRIEFGRVVFGEEWGQRHPFANWTDAMADAIAAKRPEEIAIQYSPNMLRRPTRHIVSAILRRNAQLRRLELHYCQADAVRALDSLRAPLHTLVVTPQSFYDYDFDEILTSAPMLSQLTELHLAGYVGDWAAQLIAANFTQLNVLVMDAAGMTSAGLRHLCADTALTRTTLRRLELPWSCSRGGDAAERILAMPNLEHLDVGKADAQWAAEMRRAYRQRHNRDLVVCTYGSVFSLRGLVF